MEEKQLISQLKELRQIKPSKNWASFTKKDILGDEPGFTFFPYLKPAFASSIAVFVLFGMLGFSQNSVPGDILYSVKKIAERSQAVFVSENNKPQASLELANKRLEELAKITGTNQVKNLAPAINEVQASISEAARNLSRMEATSSDPVAIKRIVDGAKKLEGKIQEVKLLGVVIGEEELNELQGASDKLEVKLVNLIILDLERRTLSKGQEEILNQMKELVKDEKYQEALELYLINQQE